MLNSISRSTAPVKIFLFYTLLLILFTGTPFAQTSHDPLKKVNEGENNFSPSISPDGSFMLFNSKRGASKYHDIYISYYKNGVWDTPQPFSVLNSPYNDETPFISHDGTIIIFSSDRDGSSEVRLSNGKIKVSYDLYISQKTAGGWSTPRRLPSSVNTTDHEKSPSMTSDNQTLFFARWENHDIRLSKIYSYSFASPDTPPQPLGSEINTGSMEVAFIPSPAGDRYYFSSQRKGGLGGWDIYYVTKNGEKFSNAVNLDRPVNSFLSEAFLAISGTRIYYASNKLNSDTFKFDILSTDLPSAARIDFKFVDQSTQSPLDPEIVSRSVKGKEKVVLDVKKEDGHYYTTLTADAEGWVLEADLDGYAPFYTHLPREQIDRGLYQFELVKIEDQAKLTIDSIYFEYNSSELQEGSFPVLDKLVKLLKKEKNLNLHITGHTDLHGSEQFNLTLSIDRAKAVQEYLSNNGIDKKRITISGKGKSDPVIDAINPYADRKNRRTEFLFRKP